MDSGDRMGAVLADPSPSAYSGGDFRAVKEGIVAGQTEATIHVVARDPDARNMLTLLARGNARQVAAYARLPENLATLVVNRPGCLVVDVSHLEAQRLELQQVIRDAATLPVIVIAPPVDVSTAVDAMKEGVFHFMERPFRTGHLVERIHAALAKDAAYRQAIARHAELRRRVASLTPRERHVMALVADGKASKVIAIDLGLSDRTVAIDRANVMNKMHAASIAQLVRMQLTLVRTMQHQHLSGAGFLRGGTAVAEGSC